MDKDKRIAGLEERLTWQLKQGLKDEDRIKELEAEVGQLKEDYFLRLEQLDDSEFKLLKAVEALKSISKMFDGNSPEAKIAKQTLKELQ